jgi:predicted O-linked N-acetylglucosamine transferase (SPINDLY family)
MSLLSRLLQKAEARAAALKAPESAGAQDLAAMMNEANGHFQAGRMDEARLAFQRILEADRGHAQALYMLGAIALSDGDTRSAMGLVHRAIALQPDRADYRFSLGSLHASQGQLAEAIRNYKEALRLKPGVPEWQLELAGALAKAGRLSEALEVYRVKLAAGVPDARAYFDLGNALQKQRRFKEAEEAFERAALLDPQSAGVHVNVAMARRDQERPVDAEPPARKAVELAPEMPQGWFALGSVLAKQARHAEAVEYYRKAIALMPDYDAAWSGLLFSMNYSERWTPREVYDVHLEWGKRFPAVPRGAVEASHRRTGHRLRVGYLSPDYWQHPVAHFIEPVLQHHDRKRFEVFCYHSGTRQDEVTARLKKRPEHWEVLGEISDDDLERKLRADRLDILVELSGHTNGSRLSVLARRVAPIQVTYLGYPNTTGLAAIDYRITDARADPPGESDELHVEKLVRLPKSFLCYAPPQTGDNRGIAPFRRNGHVTFGSFNNFAKISPTSIRLWASILTGVAGSKLFIKTHGLQDPGLRALLIERFEGAGVAAERILIAAPIASHREHMDTYNEVDIALDTFPYHGTTTTLDALWMGVPVITLAGDRHASRVGVSILSTLGLTEYVARVPDQYVALAVDLAGDAEKLDRYRRSLRERLASSPLTDGRDFTEKLEHAYLEMWKGPG